MTASTPPVTAELLSFLQSRFPNILPPPLTDLREVDMRVGEQRVIAFLGRLHKEQQDSSLEALLNPE